MSRVVERDECERCGETKIDAIRRLCPECAREVRKSRSDVL